MSYTPDNEAERGSTGPCSADLGGLEATRLVEPHGLERRKSIVLTFPLRRQVACGGRSVVSAWRDCSDRYSCTNATCGLFRPGESKGYLLLNIRYDVYTLRRCTVLVFRYK